ncbi:MAG: hypothetical protein WCI73_12110, partial [Phycisphaerae bacterium]
SHWRIDRNHSNFFTRWLVDSAQLKRQNLPLGNQTDWAGSVYDMAVPLSLQESDRQFWFEKAKAYAGHDELERLEPDRPVTIHTGQREEQFDLPANSVSMIELIPVMK